MIVLTTIMSVFDYGDALQSHAARSNLKPLAGYHRLRFITGDKYRTHHCVWYEKVGWSSLLWHQKENYTISFYSLKCQSCQYITACAEPNQQ